MLTNEQIEKNKREFIELISTIHRDGAKIDKLIDKLCSSDFFTAPASTNYHCGYVGGLCEHSLNVYHNLVSIAKDKPILYGCEDDSIKIVALLHDISKMNIYEKTSDRSIRIWRSVPPVRVRHLFLYTLRWAYFCR